MKIGILGGSFNPIQNRHLSIIKQVLNKKLVDEIWVIPCKRHAFNKELINEKYRVEMIKLAIKGFKKVKICDTELKSKEKNYTYKTIKKLKSKYNHEFFLIIGTDILNEIKRWYKFEELLKEVKFIILKRKGYSFKKIANMEIVDFIKEKASNISSSDIRDKIKKGKSLKTLLPKCIIDYINKEELYK